MSPKRHRPARLLSVIVLCVRNESEIRRLTAAQRHRRFFVRPAPRGVRATLRGQAVCRVRPRLVCAFCVLWLVLKQKRR